MVIIFLAFLISVSITSVVSGQTNSDISSENILHVSFEQNTAPSFDVNLDPKEKFILKQSYSWIRELNSRYNLHSYSIDDLEFVPISRLARGTFTLDIPTDSSHSVVFSTVIQYPVSIEGVDNYSFSPKSPTNDNWFDAKSEILITDITSKSTGLIPNEIISWDGPIVNSSGNSVQILVDGPITLTANWGANYSYLGLFLLLPIIGIIIFFINKNRGSKVSKPITKQFENVSNSDFEDYEHKIQEFLKQKSTEKLDLLIKSEFISPEKGSRLKENLWNAD